VDEWTNKITGGGGGKANIRCVCAWKGIFVNRYRPQQCRGIPMWKHFAGLVH
jgi:hypothetical protein